MTFGAFRRSPQGPEKRPGARNKAPVKKALRRLWWPSGCRLLSRQLSAGGKGRPKKGHRRLCGDLFSVCLSVFPEGARDGTQGPPPGLACERARRKTPKRQTERKVTGGPAVTFFLGASRRSPKGPNRLPGARNKAPSERITPETLVFFRLPPAFPAVVGGRDWQTEKRSPEALR